MGRLAVIVVNYAASGLLAQHLPPLAGPDTQIVVVNNHSTPAEAQVITALAAEHGWTLVKAPNEGFGAGVNRGAAAARDQGCTELLLLNPDLVIDRATVAALHEAVAADPRKLVCPRLVDSAGQPHFDGFLLDLASGQTRRGWPGDDRRVGWLSAACLAMALATFERIGGLDEGYFMYWEDVEFSWRARQAGLRLVVREDLVAVHDEGGTQQRSGRAKSDLYYRYNARNRLRFAARQLPACDWWAWLRQTPTQTMRIWLRGGRRQLLSNPGGLLAAYRGAAEGALLGAWGRLTAGRRGEPDARRTVLVAHPSPDLYGSDRVLLESVSAFIEQGDRVVAVLPAAGPLVAALRERGAQVVISPTPVLRKAALRPAGFVHLLAEAAGALAPSWRLLRRWRPEVVFVNTVTIPLWLVLGRLSGARTICHVHEAEQSAPRLVRAGLYAPLLTAQRIVINSEFARGVLASSLPVLAGRTAIVYNGVPGPPTQPEAPRPDPDPVRIYFLGRLSGRKGPQVAIDALAQLHAQGRAAELYLLGAVFEGNEAFEEQLRDQVAELGLAEHVTFLGFHPDIWALLAQADIIVVPSTVDEPFGNTAVEAMLAARPLIVSRTSGLREAAAGFATARFVEPGSASDIAAAVSELLADWPAVRQAVLADRDEAERRYSPATYRAGLRQAVAGNDER